VCPRCTMWVTSARADGPARRDIAAYAAHAPRVTERIALIGLIEGGRTIPEVALPPTFSRK
jgi:hypothetical protein